MISPFPMTAERQLVPTLAGARRLCGAGTAMEELILRCVTVAPFAARTTTPGGSCSPIGALAPTLAVWPAPGTTTRDRQADVTDHAFQGGTRREVPDFGSRPFIGCSSHTCLLQTVARSVTAQQSLHRTTAACRYCDRARWSPDCRSSGGYQTTWPAGSSNCDLTTQPRTATGA